VDAHALFELIVFFLKWFLQIAHYLVSLSL
jgi:hypothetical protein